MRSGAVGIDFMRFIGLAGYNRSCIIAALARTQSFGFNDIELLPSEGPNSFWHAFPVRCLASGA